MDSLWDSGGIITSDKRIGFRTNEEHYIGEGQANSVETSATRIGNMLSRLITEKDLFDSIFELVECDKYGKVPTSKLIEIVKLTMSGDYEELELALDPMGLDMSIDLDTFKTVVFNWEGKQTSQDLFSPQTTSTPLNSPISSYKMNYSFDFDDLNFLHVSSPGDDKVDTDTLESEISQVKYKNSKLEKENRELESQVTNLEVLYGNLQQEFENLKHKSQCLQNQMQILQKELDSSVTKHSDESNSWDKERVTLINERNELERQLKTLKDEINDTLIELTNLRNTEETLKRNFSEHETTFLQAITEKDILEEKLTSLSTSCEEFKERLLETLRNNEQLRKKRRDLQEELVVLYEKLCFNGFRNQLEDIDENNPSLDVTLENTININSTFLSKNRRESSIFDELIQNSHSDSTTIHPLCGKSPAFNFSNSQEYEWMPLTNIEFLLEEISSQLNEICAAELLDTSNHHANHTLPNISDKINSSNDVFSKSILDLGSNDLIPSPGSLSPDTLRHHINAQLQILQKHIAKSQTILISLQAISMPLIAKSSSTSTPIQPFPSLEFMSSQTPDHHIKPTLKRSESQSSTPSQRHNRTRSCPILPSETIFTTMGTQTEPIFSIATKDANTRLEQAFKDKTVATPELSIAPDFTDSDSDYITPMPLNRSSSYSEAIKRGNKEMKEMEENEELRLNRHLSVLQEEEHENSDNSPSPLICRSKQVNPIVYPTPRLPPPYRPPPQPSFTPSNVEYQSRIPIINVQPSSPSIEFPLYDQRFAQEIRLSLPRQMRQIPDPLTNETSPSQFIVCPAHLMPCVYHSMQSNDCFDAQQHLYYVSNCEPTSVVEPSPVLAKECSTIIENEAMSEEHSVQISQPSTIAVSDSGVDTATDKISDAEESDEESNKKTTRRRKRGIGSNGNNSPAIQRSKAVDFDFGYDAYECNNCKDDSDLDVKKDILEGMTQVTNRKTFSPPPLGGSPDFIISTSPKSSVEIHQANIRRKVGENQKSRLFMPELMENSETESAKNSGGSLESETEQVTSTDIINPPPASGDGPFPSLPDNFLKILQLYKTNDKIERFTEKDVEAKFHSLLLAFRTDKFTLSNRLDLHQRQRDIAEKNIDEEVIALKENLNALSQLCNDQETREIVKRLHHHLDVLHQSTIRMSSRAEVFGAVQQEDRTNRAIEVMLLYVENLKRSQEKSAADYDEMRRIMVENNLLSEDGCENEETRRNLRSYSMTNSCIGKQVTNACLSNGASKRRASIAALPRSASERLDGNTKFINFVNTSRSSVCNIGSRRCSLYYNLKSSFSSEHEKVVKKHSVDDLLIPSSSSVEHSEDEHLHRPKRLSTSRRSSKRDSIGSKNLDSPISPSLSDFENAKASDNVFTNGENVTEDDPIDSNSKLESDSGLGSDKQSIPSNWHLPDYGTEPSSEDDDVDDIVSESRKSLYASRLRPSYIADTAANLLNVSQWVNDDRVVHSVRYTIGGFLFLAALFSLFMAFFPGSQASHSCNQISNWYYSIDELIKPYRELRHRLRPPM